MQEVAKYPHCFVCGEQNKIGLKARFFFDGTQAITEIDTKKVFEGYAGIYHGGIISTLLDEVMIKAILAQNVLSVTAEMTVRFHQPVPIGITLRFTGRIVESKGRMFHTEGEAVGTDEIRYASATGKYIKARPELKTKLAASVE